MPTFADVVLQLHCDGSDGATTFTDVSNSAHTVTAQGNAQVDTAQSKWGGASLLLDGTADWIQTTTGLADFRFGTGDFTVEAWVKTTDTDFVLFDFYQSDAGVSWELYVSASGYPGWYAGNGNVLLTSTAINTGAWVHVAASRSSGTLRIFVDGVLAGSASDSHNYSTTAVTQLSIGAQVFSRSATYDFSGHIDDVRITGAAWYTGAFTPPSAAFPDEDIVEGLVSDPGPLGAVLALGAHLVTGLAEDTGPLGAPSAQVALVWGSTSDSGPLGAPAVRGHLLYGRASVDGPLGAGAALGLHDFSAVIGDAITHYVCDLETPGGLVRVPISSWQATLQTTDACYVQCVVPACAEWVEDLGDATEFVISRTVSYDGLTIEYEMARAPLSTLALAQGPTNYSATISGYSDGLVADDDPPAVYDRDLTNIRTIFTTGADTRARASIDWLLRPGHRAYAGVTEIIVDFISYYVGQGDAYMDVGERS